MRWTSGERSEEKVVRREELERCGIPPSSSPIEIKRGYGVDMAECVNREGGGDAPGVVVCRVYLGSGLCKGDGCAKETGVQRRQCMGAGFARVHGL